VKQVIFLISALILGLSMVISAFVIRDTIPEPTSNRVNDLSIAPNMNTEFPNLMTKKQLSEYLQVSQQAIDTIIKNENEKKAQMGGYDTYQFLPYLKIDIQERFLKTEVDKWLKYKSDRNQ
jgi:hypothetical protein